MRIKKFNKNDYESVMKLIKLLFPKSIIQITDSDIIYLAYKKNKLCGFIHYTFYENNLILQGIGVLNNERKKGVASLLLIKSLQDSKIVSSNITLKVKIFNSAIYLYERFGFFLKKFGNIMILEKKPFN